MSEEVIIIVSLNSLERQLILESVSFCLKNFDDEGMDADMITRFKQAGETLLEKIKVDDKK